jgi:hypothetical protein
MAVEHPAVALWHRQAALVRYPAGVLRVPKPIPGTAFFPGGYGLWNTSADRPLPEFPRGGVMVLGHDFHSESEYEASLARGIERLEGSTWRNLLDVLRRAKVPLDQCFFTNYYMGLREGVETTGPFPGANDAAFVHHCRTFLQEQLRTQLPRLLITLGITVPWGIATLSPDLEAWSLKRGLKHLDTVGAVRQNVQFDSSPGFTTTVVALTHPCFRHASVRHRRYKGLLGDAAELHLLRDALALSSARAA